MDSWIALQQAEGLQVHIFRDSGMFVNRRQIFCAVMLQDFFPEGLASLKRRVSAPTLKDNLAKKDPGPWRVGSHMMGETIPKETNFLSLDSNKKDEWGVPLIKFSVDYDENDNKMVKDFSEQLTEMYTKAGFTNIKTNDSNQAPGLDIHEMGGARMGKDPKTSMLNKWNQMHACENVFVTDGACMTSTSTQNPSLTYMALTARACDYAVGQMKKNEL